MPFLKRSESTKKEKLIFTLATIKVENAWLRTNENFPLYGILGVKSGYICQRKKQYRYTTNGKKAENTVSSLQKLSTPVPHFKLLCLTQVRTSVASCSLIVPYFWTSRTSCSHRDVMDLISSVSPISPNNKSSTGPFGACSSIFRYKLFTKSHFRCIVHKLPSTFLVLWHTKLQLFLRWLRLRRLILWELAPLDSVHSPMPSA